LRDLCTTTAGQCYKTVFYQFHLVPSGMTPGMMTIAALSKTINNTILNVMLSIVMSVVILSEVHAEGLNKAIIQCVGLD
jgi:hypothetical protein